MRSATARGPLVRFATIATAATLALTGCADEEPSSAGPTSAGATGAGHPQASERAPTMAPPSSPDPQPAPPPAPECTAVLLTIGDTTVQGQLWDNAAARDLAARLPLTLSFSDYDAVEKTGRLDPPLTMEAMPPGDDPNPGEIGWYAPSSDLVLYYGDVGYWNGIARLGTFDGSGIELLAGGPDDVTVTLTRADS